MLTVEVYENDVGNDPIGVVAIECLVVAVVSNGDVSIDWPMTTQEKH